MNHPGRGPNKVYQWVINVKLAQVVVVISATEYVPTMLGTMRWRIDADTAVSISIAT